MTAWLTGWRLALRMARRDARRSLGRSLLVVVMIALPVLAVSAAVVALSTTDVSAAEGLDRTLGTAQARLSIDSAAPYSIEQNVDGSLTAPTPGSGGGEPVSTSLPSTDELPQLLGGAAVIPVVDSEVSVRSSDGVARAAGVQVDLTDPLADGLLDLREGRLPRTSDEVVVNQALLDEGYAVGDVLRVGDAAEAADAAGGPVIVGVAESTTVRTLPFVAGPVGSLPVEDTATVRSYLVGGGPVSWSQVQELNARGVAVLSRSVVLDPPPDAELPEQFRSSGGGDAATVTVAILVVTMALLEVVLLAGPAFAVGARRLQRSLALLAAAGGTPAQARRVVLGGAVVLGLVAAVSGVVLGIALAAAVLPLLQHYSDTYLGPFDVPVPALLGVAALGLLSALLAAVVPAWLASRQDVVAVLAGRRGDAHPSYRSPVVGAILLGIGVAVSAAGTGPGGETQVAAGAVLSVLGMILLVPVVVSLVARLSARLPLSTRYAARDAARQRTRTTPAVAAVAATVAGVVALLIANTSDAEQNQETYVASLADGYGAVTSYGAPSGPDSVDLDSLGATVRRIVPDAGLTLVQGVVYPDDPNATYSYTSVARPGSDYDPFLASGSYAALGSDLLVSDTSLPPGLPGLSDEDRDAASSALAGGGLVVFTDDDDAGAAPDEQQVDLRTETYGSNQPDTATDTPEVSVRTLTATAIHASGGSGTPSAVLSTPVATSIGLDVAPTGLVVGGATISRDQEEAISEAIAATTDNAGFYVERGYQGEQATLILQLVLLGLGAVLMLGGTLTATFLALSDARPDLSTLAAIGASPRRRRGIAASYALVVGFVGALLGAAVGFVPGVAVSFTLTRPFGFPEPGDPTHYLEIPWLMILGLVVALPLVTAAIVAAATRSQLPLVGRVD